MVLPLLATKTLDAGPFAVSLLRVASWLPWLVIGLPVGAFFDNASRRRVIRIMIVCDLVSAAALVTVPLAAWLHGLGMAQLLTVSLIIGAAGVPFSTAYLVVIRTLLKEPSEAIAGNSALQGSESAASVAGPGLGGVFVAAFTAATAVLADAVSFVVSAFCLMLLQRRDDVEEDNAGRVAAPTEHVAMVQRLKDGVKYLRRQPMLTTITVFGGLSNLALSGLGAIVVVFLVRRTHLSSTEIGLVVACGGLGGVAGALVARPLGRLLGDRRAIIVAKVGGSASALLIPLATKPALAGLAAAGEFLLATGVVAGNIFMQSLVQRVVPEEIFGRTLAITSFVSYATMPLGALLAGGLAGLLGLHAAVWIIAGIGPAACAVLFGPGLRIDMKHSARQAPAQ